MSAGHIPGPRILAAGRKLITRGDYLQDLNPVFAEAILSQEFLFIDCADSARAAVRQNVFQNVDVIKVSADENLTVPELTSAVEETHRNHLKIAVHAFETASIQTILFDLTPTFYGGFLLKIMEPSIVVSPSLRAQYDSSVRGKQRYDQLVERVLRSGVKVAAGSDMCSWYPGKTRGEASVATLLNLHDAGMSSLEVIRAVTTNAMDMLGWQDRPGY